MLENLMQQINPWLYLAIVVIGWFIVRTLRQIDRNQEKLGENQSKLWDRSDDHEQRLAHIEGEHRIFTTRGGHGK